MSQKQPNPSTFETTPQARPDVTRTFESTVGTLAGIAERSGGWVKEQVHTGLQDFVSRVLLGETVKSPEPEKDKEVDKGLDR